MYLHLHSYMVLYIWHIHMEQSRKWSQKEAATHLFHKQLVCCELINLSTQIGLQCECCIALASLQTPVMLPLQSCLSFIMAHQVNN